MFSNLFLTFANLFSATAKVTGAADRIADTTVTMADQYAEQREHQLRLQRRERQQQLPSE